MKRDLLLATGPLADAWASRTAIEALGTTLRVVSREQLIKMKALAGRLRPPLAPGPIAAGRRAGLGRESGPRGG